MRILTRYILREITGYLLLSGVLFTFILFTRYLLPLMELAVRGAVSPLDVGRLIGFLLPSFFTLTVPLAVLAGILLGLSRLGADSEITAMRASGVGVIDFLRIVSVVGGLCWGLSLLNSLYVAPRAAGALLAFEERNKTARRPWKCSPACFMRTSKITCCIRRTWFPAAGQRCGATSSSPTLHSPQRRTLSPHGRPLCRAAAHKPCACA